MGNARLCMLSESDEEVICSVREVHETTPRPSILSDTEKPAANVVLSRCRRHHRSCRAAATALPPLRCAPLPRCRRPCAVALPPPPPPSRSRSLVVVALLCTVRFRHRMPSCDHQRSCCRPLSPINCLPPPPPPPPPPLPLPPPPQPPRCCHRAATVTLCNAAATAADAAATAACRQAGANIALSRCRHRLAHC
jgi:hypothetical protein